MHLITYQWTWLLAMMEFFLSDKLRKCESFRKKNMQPREIKNLSSVKIGNVAADADALHFTILFTSLNRDLTTHILNFHQNTFVLLLSCSSDW